MGRIWYALIVVLSSLQAARLWDVRRGIISGACHGPHLSGPVRFSPAPHRDASRGWLAAGAVLAVEPRKRPERRPIAGLSARPSMPAGSGSRVISEAGDDRRGRG